MVSSTSGTLIELACVDLSYSVRPPDTLSNPVYSHWNRTALRVHTHAHTRTHAHAHIHTYTHTHTHTHAHIHTNTHTHTHAHAYTLTLTLTLTLTRTHARIHTHTHTDARAHTHTTHTHAHAHTSVVVKLVAEQAAVPPELYIAHTTWTGYEQMTRVYKMYDFAYSEAGGRTAIAFSGYPGNLYSDDDWYHCCAKDLSSCHSFLPSLTLSPLRVFTHSLHSPHLPLCLVLTPSLPLLTLLTRSLHSPHSLSSLVLTPSLPLLTLLTRSLHSPHSLSSLVLTPSLPLLTLLTRSLHSPHSLSSLVQTIRLRQQVRDIDGSCHH
jgi:hypothetical protein